MNRTILFGLLAGAGVFIGYVFFTKKTNESFAEAAAAKLVSSSVGAAGSGVKGIVLGLGDSVGLPRVNESDCDKAIGEGNDFRASLYCSAPDFFMKSRGNRVAINSTAFSPDFQKYIDSNGGSEAYVRAHKNKTFKASPFMPSSKSALVNDSRPDYKKVFDSLGK